MSLRNWKRYAAILVLLVTVGAFIYYFMNHGSALRQLGHVPAWTFALLLALYLLFLGTLVWIQSATLALCDTSLRPKENLLLTIYSSIVNFFGPLQSGPGFRAVYLKQKHGTKLKNYTLATLLYYGFFALFSGLFLLSGVLGRWIFVVLIAAAIAIPLVLRIPHPFIKKLRVLQLDRLGDLALATAAQVSMVAIIYFVELHSVNGHITMNQAVIYAGAANFALFVSLTPGAIGFRESFLLFAHHLHGISDANVLTASLLDRAMYIIFLGVLFVVAISLHAKDFLGVRRLKKATAKSAAADLQ